MRLPWRKRDQTFSLEQWNSYLQEYFTHGGLAYGLTGRTTMPGQKQESPAANLDGYAGMYQRNGVLFAVVDVRLKHFSEARFQFRQLRQGRPGDLFGTAELGILERPWPNGTTGDLLARMEQDSSLAGNFYAARLGDTVHRLRPDWVTIVLGADPSELEAQIIGYQYHPGGLTTGRDPVNLLVDRVAHYAPIPDPLARFRGMSWLTPVIRELLADNAATAHKQAFYENAATPNLGIKLDPNVQIDAFKKWVELFRQEYEGAANAYKTLILGGGADFTVLGANMEEMQFKITQGAGETRLAAAAGVPPVIVGLSEGLQAATYSNYSQARRRFADGTLRPLWRNAASSLSPLVNVPGGSELWYDDRDIPALRDDELDVAEIQQKQATTIKTLVDAGFLPEMVVAAVASGDLTRLSHTGLFSVQLQKPGDGTSSNGQGEPAAALAALEEGE